MKQTQHKKGEDYITLEKLDEHYKTLGICEPCLSEESPPVFNVYMAVKEAE